MTHNPQDFRNGIRYAITWLHRRAAQMNDPHAQTVLNSAGFNLGVDLSQGRIGRFPKTNKHPVDVREIVPDLEK